jgi:hypothetical protein
LTRVGGALPRFLSNSESSVTMILRMKAKFRSNVGKRWPAERTDAILQKFWALDRTNDVRSLRRAVTPGMTSSPSR